MKTYMDQLFEEKKCQGTNTIALHSGKANSGSFTQKCPRNQVDILSDEAVPMLPLRFVALCS